MLFRPLALPLAALLILANAAAAQTEVAGSAAVNSSGVFRGVTDTNRPVLEGTATVVTTWRRFDLGAGAWGAAEPKTYRGANEYSLLGDAARPGLTQGSLWVDATSSLEGVSATVGVTTYLYPAVAGLAETYNTAELYGSATLDAPLAPTFTVYHDVARISGAYLEAGLEHTLLSGSFGDFTIGVMSGWSLGQAMGKGVSSEVGYFSRNGLTHTEISATGSRSLGSLTLAANAHLVFAHDSYARTVAPDREQAAKLWMGLSVGWSSSSPEGGEEPVQP